MPLVFLTCADDFMSAFDDPRGAQVVPRLAATLTGAGREARARVDDDRLYSEVSFAATHNSYAGLENGRGSIPDQLDRGVRMIELDVHDDDYGHSGYRVGHMDPGDQVFHGGGNPVTDKLPDWLDMIANWSSQNAGHAPITLLLDLKDELDDNPSEGEGNLVALNRELVRAFGSKLLPASEVEGRGWPTIGALRNHILVVLSGDEASRAAYRAVRATNPAVGMNAAGQVVEVHDSGRGELWYWTGRYQADGSVAWLRTTLYDTGQNPSVDVDDDGTVVEVHEDPDLNDYQLWYRVGHLDDDGEIRWLASGGQPFPNNDDGMTPTIRLRRDGDSDVREVHRSPSGAQRWYWDGRIDRARGTIAWTRNAEDFGQTEDVLFNKTRATAGGRRIAVSTGSSRAFGSDTLLYETDGNPAARIRPPQLAFVEFQPGSRSELQNDGLFFCAGPAGEAQVRSWARAWRSAGKIARLWAFDGSGLSPSSTPVTFPATDSPFEKWYDDYCRWLGCVR